MKKQFLLPLMALFTSTLIFAQQNVGVGIPSPKQTLHVHSPGTFSFLNTTNNATTDASFRGLLLGVQSGVNYLWRYKNYPI